MTMPPYNPGAPTSPAPTSVGPNETITPPPRRKSRLPWILLAAGAVLFLIVLTVVITLAASSDSGTHAAKAPSAWDREQSANAATPADAGEQGVPTDEPTTGPTVSAKDMTVWLKVTEKQCYGYDIGCDLTVEVRAKRNAGVPKPDPDDTWQVTYQISGVKDGPVIGTFEITGGKYEINEENLSTKSSSSKPTIKVTSVEKLGI